LPSLIVLIGLMSSYCLGFGMAMTLINRITIMTSKEGMGMTVAMFDLILVTTGSSCALALYFINNNELLPISIILVILMFLCISLNLIRSPKVLGQSLS